MCLCQSRRRNRGTKQRCAHANAHWIKAVSECYSLNCEIETWTACERGVKHHPFCDVEYRNMFTRSVRKAAYSTVWVSEGDECTLARYWGFWNTLMYQSLLLGGVTLPLLLERLATLEVNQRCFSWSRAWAYRHGYIPCCMLSLSLSLARSRSLSRSLSLSLSLHLSLPLSISHLPNCIGRIDGYGWWKDLRANGFSGTGATGPKCTGRTSI